MDHDNKDQAFTIYIYIYIYIFTYVNETKHVIFSPFIKDIVLKDFNDNVRVVSFIMLKRWKSSELLAIFNEVSEIIIK